MLVRKAVDSLRDVVSSTDPTRMIPTRLGGMRFDDFLATRCVEGVVHGLDLAFRCFERVVVLVDGKIVADAPAAELIADARLDAACGVRFERIRTAEGWSLLASKTKT